MISYYIAIGLGGGAGAILRVALGKLLPTVILGIPFQILLVNILGCLMMGLLTEMLPMYEYISNNILSFLISGFLGGFTTFSSFTLEFGLLFERQEYLLAIYPI